MTSQEALILSLNNNKTLTETEIIKTINNSIEETCKSGKFSCMVDVNKLNINIILGNDLESIIQYYKHKGFTVTYNEYFNTHPYLNLSLLPKRVLTISWKL